MTGATAQLTAGKGRTASTIIRSSPVSRPASDAALLLDQIAAQTSAIERTLNRQLSRSEGGYLPPELAERRELRRQLGALRDSISQARFRSGHDPDWWRAELATLLCFTSTLLRDAQDWRGHFDERVRGVAHDQAAARRAHARWTAEHAPVIRRRDELQAEIDQTARRMVDETGGEYRRTFPCFSLAESLIVCSVWVLRPGWRLWPAQRWLVTLDGAHQRVLVRRCYA